MRLCSLLLFSALAHAADVKAIECKDITPAPLPRQMGKTVPEFNCVVTFTGKAQKETLYVTNKDGETRGFQIDKGSGAVAVATGHSPAVSAKLGQKGKLYQIP